MSSLFSHLIGHKDLKYVFEDRLKKRLFPPVSLFYGPSGVGKVLFAKALAQGLTGTTKKECPDIHLLAPEGKSSLHPVQAMREMIQETVLPPFESLCKVFIIEEAHLMLPVSSNALLKVLEEPPSDTYFILTSSDIIGVLPTIVSRCAKWQFFPIPEEEICQFLKETVKLSEEESKKMALLSEGSLGKALFMAQHPCKKLLSNLLDARDYPQLLQALSELDEGLDLNEDNDSERLKQIEAIFEEILYWVRDKHPFKLEKALLALMESRQALTHHLKLKTVLENFFLSMKF